MIVGMNGKQCQAVQWLGNNTEVIHGMVARYNGRFTLPTEGFGATIVTVLGDSYVVMPGDWFLEFIDNPIFMVVTDKVMDTHFIKCEETV
jgi:hypothetical protein